MSRRANVPSLRVTEIFWSLQGETSRIGLPTVFVRLTGCPLRCTWCDTDYAFSGGRSTTIDAILDAVATHSPRYVTVTGGEPLAQKHTPALLAALCDAGYSVSVETGGALPIAAVDERVSRIVDVKCPGSGEVDKNRWENLALLAPQDELKFVLKDRSDYAWARELIGMHKLDARCPILFSPVHGQLELRELAQWILADRLPVRFQYPLHKLIWGQEPGR